MMEQTQITLPAYEISFNLRIGWTSHSGSNQGSGGTNFNQGRSQRLADGSLTDALSGNMIKHHHAGLLTEFARESGLRLCPACAQKDSRRAAALTGRPEYKEFSIEQALQGCVLCDTHGFLVTAKNATGEEKEARQRLNKHTLIDVAMALALPERQAKSIHIGTRVGDSKEEGQMLYKFSARSAEYAWCIRYKSVGVGMDTDKWQLVVKDDSERRLRHQLILAALQDYLLSPDCAQSATLLPHLASFKGIIMVKTGVGRAPIYSGLDDLFVDRLKAMTGPYCRAFEFGDVSEFYRVMEELIETTVPYRPVINSANYLNGN